MEVKYGWAKLGKGLVGEEADNAFFEELNDVLRRAVARGRGTRGGSGKDCGDETTMEGELGRKEKKKEGRRGGGKSTRKLRLRNSGGGEGELGDWQHNWTVAKKRI